jgi:hypothetical protein
MPGLKGEELGITSYQTASDYLSKGKKSKFSRKLPGKATMLIKDGSSIHVVYHQTPVVTFKEDGDIILQSDGYMTQTTKERMNNYTPERVGVSQAKGLWFLSVDRKVVIYQDGIVIHQDGTVTGDADKARETEVKKIVKTITQYATDFAQALVNGQVLEPSAGDCWYCFMKTEDGLTLGEAEKNNDHITTHIQEKYYVPSLMVRAVERFGGSHYLKSSIAWIWEGNPPYHGSEDYIKREVKSFLVRYLKQLYGIAD